MSSDLSARYARIPVGVLSDILVKAGAPHQVLSREIRSFVEMPPFAGPAFCIRGARAMGGAPALQDQRFDLYRRFVAGSILVMASGGHRLSSVLGENMAASLQQRGCTGIVTDSGYRDRDGIAALGIPVRAGFVTPLSSGGQWQMLELDTTVTLPGETQSAVRISHGDMIVCDGDGIIVIPRHGALAVLEDAETLLEIEARTRALIQAGEDSEHAYKTNPRFGHVRPLTVA